MTWTDAPVPLYVAKRLTRGTVKVHFANPLMDDYHFITECRTCSDETRSSG